MIRCLNHINKVYIIYLFANYSDIFIYDKNKVVYKLVLNVIICKLKKLMIVKINVI